MIKFPFPRPVSRFRSASECSLESLSDSDNCNCNCKTTLSDSESDIEMEVSSSNEVSLFFPFFVQKLKIEVMRAPHIETTLNIIEPGYIFYISNPGWGAYGNISFGERI